jgi:hypothetical protein
MASVILSFVGSQDPFAKTDTEGSIITLVKHLLQEQAEIKQVILLHTTRTVQNAIDTKEWLESDPVNLVSESVTLMPVNDLLSADPVNLLLAVEAARLGLEYAIGRLAEEDVLEFNASSGTPVMKSAWSILQAAGYAPGSHVWQIRNPKEMQVDQPRVFQTDVDRLRKEFDLKIIKQQVQDYNYRGAWTTLENSGLVSERVTAMLKYGYYRLALDFDRAFSSAVQKVDTVWIQEIAALRANDRRMILRDAYFHALIQLNNKQYFDFLVSLSKLREGILRFLVEKNLALPLSTRPADREQSWRIIQQFEDGKLYRYLQQCRVPSGGRLRLNEDVSQYTHLAILEYFPSCNEMVRLLGELNEYCALRNSSVHEFVGVSEIRDESKLLSVLQKVMRQAVGIPRESPFHRLNQQIFQLLDRLV